MRLIGYHLQLTLSKHLFRRSQNSTIGSPSQCLRLLRSLQIKKFWKFYWILTRIMCKWNVRSLPKGVDSDYTEVSLRRTFTVVLDPNKFNTLSFHPSPLFTPYFRPRSSLESGITTVLTPIVFDPSSSAGSEVVWKESKICQETEPDIELWVRSPTLVFLLRTLSRPPFTHFGTLAKKSTTPVTLMRPGLSFTLA